MGYLMAPGERPELIAIALPRRLQEADRGVVHGEGVGAERPGVPLNEDETCIEPLVEPRTKWAQGPGGPIPETEPAYTSLNQLWRTRPVFGTMR